MLPLRILEPLSCALLTVLLAFFAARVAGDHALRLELLSQFGVEEDQGARHAKFNGICLTADASAGDIGDHIEITMSLGGHQRQPRTRALLFRHKILIEGSAIDLEFATTRTQIDARNSRLAASRPIILN